MNTRCINCKRMLYRTDPCKGTTGVCGRTDGGSKKMSGGSSAVEQRVANPKAEGSTPSPRSKPIVGRPKDGPAKKSASADPAPSPRMAERASESRKAHSGQVKKSTAAADKPKRIDTRKGDRHRADYWKTYQRPDRAAKAAKEPK